MFVVVVLKLHLLPACSAPLGVMFIWGELGEEDVDCGGVSKASAPQGPLASDRIT